MLTPFEQDFVTPETLRLLEEKLALGLWTWDLDTGVTVWSRGLYDVLGVEPGTPPSSYGMMQQIVHPDDRKPESEVVQALRDSVAVDREIRIIMSDGRMRWVRSRIEPVMTEGRTPSRAIGLCTDITRLRDTTHFLKVMSDRFTALRKTATALIWMTPPDGSRVEIMGGRAAANTDSTDLKALMHPDDRAAFEAELAAALPSRQPFGLMVRLHTNDGYRPHVTRAAPIVDDNGEIREWVGVSRDPRDSEQGSGPAAARVITGAQMRAARAILRWSVADLAKAAQVSPAAIRRLEDTDEASSSEPTHGAVEAALQQAGVELTFAIDGKPGVRPR